MGKIRVVVSMHGGTIDSVLTDSDQEVEVVFTEATKHIEDEDCFEIASGPLKGEAIYCHHDAQEVRSKELEPVFKAAQKRIDSASWTRPRPSPR